MEKDKNNLEEFLRSHLENYEAADNGWNVPPDDLWEGVKPQINTNAPRSIFKPFGKWLPLFLVISASILFTVFQSAVHQKEINQLSSELESLKIELSNVSRQVTPAATESLSITKDVGTSDLPQLSKREVAETDRTIQAIAQRSIAPANPDMEWLGDLTTSMSVRSFGATKQVNEIGPEDQNQEEISLELTTIRATSTPLLESEKKFNPEEFAPLSPPTIPELKHQDTLTIANRTSKVKHLIKGHPSIKFSLGSMFADRFLDTIPEGFESYVTHEYRGLSLGLNLEWPLSRSWYVETGLNYHHYAAESHHHRDFRYSEAKEDVPGLGPNDFQIRKRFHSAIGHVGTTLVMTHGPLTPAPSEKIDISFDSDTHAHYLGVPLALKYKLRIGRLGLFLRGGLMGSILVHQHFKVKHLVPHHKDISFKYSDRTTQISDVKKFHLQYLIGAGLDFHVSPYYALHIEPTFSRSLSPLTTIEGVRIGLQTIGIRGGLKLHF